MENQELIQQTESKLESNCNTCKGFGGIDVVDNLTLIHCYSKSTYVEGSGNAAKTCKVYENLGERK